MGDLDRFRVRLPMTTARGQLGPGCGHTAADPRPPSVQDVLDEYSEPKGLAGGCLLLFDATGSMHPYWEHVKDTIGKVIARLLGVGGRPALKIVAYRDDCDGDRVIEPSAWSGQAAELRGFLRKVACSGGGDEPEAVDRALQVALEEQGEVSGVVLIGDAPPHPHRDGRKEAMELAKQQRPVYPIVVGKSQETRAAFAEIARLSGGRLLELDRLDELYEILGVVIAHRMGEEIFKEYLARYDRQLADGARRAARMLTDGQPGRR